MQFGGGGKAGEKSVYGDDASSVLSAASQPGKDEEDPEAALRRERARVGLRAQFARHTDEKDAGNVPDHRLKMTMYQFKQLVRELLDDDAEADGWAEAAYSLAPKSATTSLTWPEFWAMLPKRSSMFAAISVGKQGQRIYFQAFFRGAERRLVLKRQRMQMMAQFQALFDRYALAHRGGPGADCMMFTDFYSFLRELPHDRELTQVEAERQALSLWLHAKAMWRELREDMGKNTAAASLGTALLESAVTAGTLAPAATPQAEGESGVELTLPEARARRTERMTWQEFAHFCTYTEAFYGDPTSNKELARRMNELVPPEQIAMMKRQRCCNAFAPGKKPECAVM